MAEQTEKDKLVQKLIEVANKQKADIAKAEKPKWKTNLNFRYNPDSSAGTNLHTISDPKKLAAALAFLMDKKGSYTKACKELGIKDDFEWLGFTLEEWKSDFKTKVMQINLKEEKKKLETTLGKLDKLISKEVREAMELAAIAKELGV